MDSFQRRASAADVLVQLIDTFLWKVEPASKRLTIVPYGYETHTMESVRQLLRYVRTTTAKLIRFSPDYFVFDSKSSEPVYFLEYKVTQTPIYSLNRIRMIGQNARIPNLTWQNIGQMEADAYDNCMTLYKAGCRVVILNFCPYHSRLLLCDFIQNIQVLYKDTVQTQSKNGSGTPFINFNLNSMRTLDTFLNEEHSLVVDRVKYKELQNTLGERLPVTHAINSPLH
ncbi:MAG TPA: hypothetical protein VH186_32455 [Chloroflexia bacterium]|nr:hypothetical protein [Chloroflexia bacterium]